jgi:hypothetical protein
VLSPPAAAAAAVEVAAVVVVVVAAAAAEIIMMKFPSRIHIMTAAMGRVAVVVLVAAGPGLMSLQPWALE